MKKKPAKKRARTGKVKLPDWFDQFAKNLALRKRPACLRGEIKTMSMFQAGAVQGYEFCELDKLREDYLTTHPTAQVIENFNEKRNRLAERIGKAALMREDDAVEFLSGILAEMKRCNPSRGYEDAAVTKQLFQQHSIRLLACRTTREVADLVMSHLSPEIVARWTEDQRIAFYKRVRMYCRRIGWTPSRRGRPAKK